ncbi:25S rRNA (adenine2142-N1)-methyltransferase [Recurvomyces mirabilis]|nr:25S rRNA (adenine2142-N1)-methyltransferase [Recurvomyces mirabilis]
MRCTALIFAGLVSLGACAAVETKNAIDARDDGTNSCKKQNCMDDSQAEKVADNFAHLVSAYTKADADAVMAPDFLDYSDSVTALINSGCPNGPVPYGAPTFASRDQFEAGQSSQPNITFTILSVWHNCDTVILRWRGPLPNPFPNAISPQQAVTGLIVIETTFQGFNCPQPFLIKTVFSEFNSAAWLYDLSVFVPNCTADGFGYPPAGAPAKM